MRFLPVVFVPLLLIVSCQAPYTKEQRAELIDVVTLKVSDKMGDVVAGLGKELEKDMAEAIKEKAADLEVSEEAAKKLAESLPAVVTEVATKLVNEKAPEVVRKTMDDFLPEGEDPGEGLGGAIAGFFGMLLQAGLASAKG